jgi:type IV pilus assembly protein PilO
MSTQNPSVMQERLASPLTWHYVGLAVMILVVAGLGVRLGMDWSATNGRSSDALASKQFQLRSLEMQTDPLRGLDARVGESRGQIDDFYAKRIPANYSSIAKRIGELGVKSGVRLTGLQYTQGATVGDLTEISMDARISGEYSQIMRFINGLERDQNFFVIKSMGLTGQQGGMVNLRLQVSTWLRRGDVPNGLLPTPEEKPASATPAAQEGE